jgi:hypothetical protein
MKIYLFILYTVAAAAFKNMGMPLGTVRPRLRQPPSAPLRLSQKDMPVDIPDMTYSPVDISKVELYQACRRFHWQFDRFKLLREILNGSFYNN